MSLTRTVEEWTTRYEGGALNPGFARIAEAMLREGRIEDAIAFATEGLQMQPTSLSGHLVLGRCHREAGRLDEAKTQFEIALRMDPRCPAARFHLAQIAEQLQWKSVALEHWRTLCEIEPWDDKAREGYGRMLREAPGNAPAPKLGTSFPAAATAGAAASGAGLASDHVYNPDPIDSLGAESAAAAGLTEYSLDSVADFLPKDENPSAEIFAATLAAPAIESIPSAPVEKAFPEPQPVDLLETTDKGADAQPLEAAPFSGEDVASRLHALFGMGDGVADAPTEAEPTGLGETQHHLDTQIHSDTHIQSSSQFQSDSQMHRDSPADGDAFLGGEATVHGEVPQQDDITLPGEATAYARAAVTDFFEGPSPVAGDDVADRLDNIFESTDTRMQEVVKASHFTEPGSSEASAWTPVAPDDLAEPATPIDTQELKTEPAESEARAAGESNILSIEEVHDTPSTEPEVTGEDIADRLDMLFEESAGASAVFAKPEAEIPVVASPETAIPETIVDPGTSEHALTELTDAHTLAMPAMREPDLQALQFPGSTLLIEPQNEGPDEARETMILSADILQAEPQSEAQPFLATSAQPEFLPEAPTYAFSSEKLDTVDLKPASEAALFATDDAITPESLGLPEVGGGDIGQRLDDLFGEDLGSSLLPKSNVTEVTETTPRPGVTVNTGKVLETPESLETLETALAASPDLVFEAPVQGEPVVSGDDISSRLAEIFGSTSDELPTTEARAEAQAIESDPVDLEAAARGTHFDAAEDMPTMAIRVQRDESEKGPGDISDADFPPWLAEPETQPEVQPQALAETADHAAELGEAGEESEEAFEPATTSVATVTLAEIYFTQGLKEQALQIYRQLLEREPENESVSKRIQEIEASKAEGDDKGSGPDDSRPRPGLKIPRRKK